MSGTVIAQFVNDAIADGKVELRQNWTEDDLQKVFRAAYEQVFGRQGVYASQRFASAESLLRNGKTTVRQFVRTLAKSEFYRECFFHNNSQGRFIELNYKHLLGRAPYDQSEVAYHVDLYASKGLDADIDAYIDSPEYDAAFGDWVVPFHRGFQSQLGQKTVGFPRMFALYRGAASSDNSQYGRRNARLRTQISRNQTNWITPPSSPSGLSFGSRSAGTLGVSPAQGDSRMFVIEAIAGTVGSRVPVRRSVQVYNVPFERLSATYQEIHKTGGKIVRITPV
ncbi:MAG: Phycobilisome 34.5 kDa linker polypeptide, phycoerythrocyanin-associated, rod [Chroococcidiopsis cubana SAG 39.79]|jgi:hypothetical protein|uniref:Phycobilisome 32.1 kDa linker polypeptide, phycocyanin-associated, rod n=1 Tax=Chroococcidiopsis cubana SAG 39.79 TaxID=388085 RepID=A0AB37UKR3_9CYAN|nr:phycobilisome linker polypeptide [Chroococcidiopsis cubana]MDZ4871291.1 Phycobilisome 34.5 kDa linker polypeptide, phycoerythrocyanin-associated, rod [Chroococcidiopsis cubana SAG 39.79]PSB63977.1 photosystem I reaction center subunit XII [Chroococcidiopsis cubana CCALA 043]RUT11945.1 phycobilisome 32.1 kDa linker polypeptide, phycocyanin-associated, rod [Chroococcidiopsis cubana SAG 39.79]